MSDLFLCGALGDRAIAALILGAKAGAFDPHAVPDCELRAIWDCEHAVLMPAAGQAAPGLILRQASARLHRRLQSYLEVYGIALEPRVIQGRELLVPVYPGPIGPAWCEETWRRDLSLQVEKAAREILAYLETHSPAEAAQRLTPVRTRAALWAKARSMPPDDGFDPERDVRVEATHHRYMNFFAVHEMDLQFRKQDGSMSNVVNRGALMMSEASGVLPYDPAADAVLLIRQFRAPLFMGGSTSPWVWEPVAGLVDPGETPQEAAHRETMEEAGLTLRHLEPLGPTHGSPGSLSDRLNLYIGLTDLADMRAAGGLSSEDEDIHREIFAFDDFIADLDAGRFTVLPLIVLGLWLARHRDRLRAMA